jgi:hypothetical protein
MIGGKVSTNSHAQSSRDGPVAGDNCCMC